MRWIFRAALFALPWLLIEAPSASAQTPIPAQFPGCDAAGYGGYGGGSQGGYYRQSLYTGSPIAGGFSFALRMYPLIHFHGPLVNYGPYEGYYPFEPYGPWTSDLKYNGPPIPKHPHLANFNSGTAATGWIWGSHSHCHSHGWGHYALSTFHNIHLRTHPCSSHHKSCSSGNCASTLAVVPTVTER